ncbi:MAG: hypothetical protein NZ934_01930 [Hadesarchaea archaeon]|nr:hypothetical protein [Hadesarchaea archaeon]
MTFEQSELQRLVEVIIDLLQRYWYDPSVMEVIQSELDKLYRKIPIYAGIQANCLSEVVTPIPANRLNGGEEVSVLMKSEEIVTGKVAEITPSELKLVGCKQFERPKSCPEVILPIQNIREVRLLARDILKKEWPSLDFKV